MRGYNPQDCLHTDRVGKEFEHSCIVLWKQKFENNKTLTITDVSDTDADKKEGTDLLCGDIRIDVTTDFAKKDNMPYIADTGIPATRTQNFQIGIRHGNNYKDRYHPFPYPVVVIGVDVTPGEYYRNQEIIEENIQKHAHELIQLATDVLDDYQTTDPKERQEILDRQILKHNPTYHQPRNLAARYRRIEELRQKFEFTGDIPDGPSTPEME